MVVSFPKNKMAWLFGAACALCIALVMCGGFVPQPAHAAGGSEGLALTAGDASASQLTGSQSSVTVQKKSTKVGVDYRAEMQHDGKLDRVSNGAIAGIVDGSKYMKRLVVWLDTGAYKGGVTYRVYNKGSAWSNWVKGGKNAGMRNKQMEALQVKLTGKIAGAYDIRYRAYVKDVGWQPWVCNGGTAGKTGQQVQAVQMKLQKKRTAKAALKEGVYKVTSTTNASFQMTEKNAMLVRGGSSASAAGKFYVRNEADGISLQSVSTGRFVSANDTKVQLKKWTGKDNQIWTLSWDGGLRLTNKANGKQLTLVGKSFKLKKAGNGFDFTSTNLVDDGSYAFKNTAKGKVLDVKNGSYSAGANVRVFDSNGSGAQVFNVTNLKGGWLKIVNAMTWMALDVEGASAEKGANIQQWDDNGTHAQQWSAGMARDGSLYFINRASEKALSAAGDAKSGANVKSNPYADRKSQHWTLSPATYTSPTGDYELDRELASIVAAYPTLWDCFNYVSSFSYISGSKYGSHTMSDSTTLDMAKEMIWDGGGNCYRFAALFSWLARFLGYDTEVIAGYVPAAAGGAAPHGWVEVYEDGTTYVCDPDLNHEMGGASRWYMNTYAGAPIDYWF